MPEPRSVVVTGASRGLGLASAAQLYARGWRVVGAMRAPDAGLERLRAATGAVAGDPRLLGVRLDLAEPASVAAAARTIEEAVGAPDALVHNAGIAAFGSVEDTPLPVWQQLFSTNLFGPVALTRALLPPMRAAGRGRIVVVSSQGGARGMPGIAPYAASKGALERWAESLAQEVAPFGLGVTILVAGTFDTGIITEQTPDHGDYAGPYGAQYASIRRRGLIAVQSLAAPPERFARALARSLEERAPFVRHAVGLDAHLVLHASRFLPGRLLHHLIRMAMGLPRHGALADEPRPSSTTDAEPEKSTCRSSMP